jgi:hypothetical protein
MMPMIDSQPLKRQHRRDLDLAVAVGEKYSGSYDTNGGTHRGILVLLFHSNEPVVTDDNRVGIKDRNPCLRTCRYTPTCLQVMGPSSTAVPWKPLLICTI